MGSEKLEGGSAGHGVSPKTGVAWKALLFLGWGETPFGILSSRADSGRRRE